MEDGGWSIDCVAWNVRAYREGQMENRKWETEHSVENAGWEWRMKGCGGWIRVRVRAVEGGWVAGMESGRWRQ